MQQNMLKYNINLNNQICIYLKEIKEYESFLKKRKKSFKKLIYIINTITLEV